jgi:hypothetical protein
MSTRLVIDSSNQLKELKDQAPAVRLLAKVISYVFHPLFIPAYIILFLLYVHPSVFAGFPPEKKLLVFLQSLLPYIVLPIVTVLLLKALNFIHTVFLVTQRDRIIPYIACNLWYFWIAYVWYNQPDYPKEIVTLAIMIFIASVIGQLANIYIKISMHAIATGVMVSFVVFLAMTDSSGAGLYISVALIIAGLICSARFIAGRHTQKEIYSGLLAGPVALFVALLFTYHQ